MTIENIINKINKNADTFEEVRKITLDVVCEINEKSKYPMDVIPKKPNLRIVVEDMGIYFDINPDEIKNNILLSGLDIKQQIIKTISKNI